MQYTASFFYIAKSLFSSSDNLLLLIATTTTHVISGVQRLRQPVAVLWSRAVENIVTSVWRSFHYLVAERSIFPIVSPHASLNQRRWREAKRFTREKDVE